MLRIALAWSADTYDVLQRSLFILHVCRLQIRNNVFRCSHAIRIRFDFISRDNIASKDEKYDPNQNGRSSSETTVRYKYQEEMEGG